MNSPSVQNNLLFFLIFLIILCTLLFIKPIDTQEEETIIEEYLICRHCGSDITITNFFLNKLSPLALSSRNHTFFKSQPVLVQTLENSLGVQFKVAIVRRAHCAIVNSRWSDHFTWFPGYDWKICLCPKCDRQLGWMFEPSDSESIKDFPSERGFYALIIGDILSESYVNSLLMTENHHKEL